MIFLDVETVPPPMTDAEKQALVRAPSNYGAEAAIRYRAEPGRAHEAWAALALDPLECTVAVVGYAIDGGPVLTADLDAALDVIANGDDIAGHNLDGFDLPVLWFAALRAGHTQAARRLSRIMAAKPWERQTCDTMAALSHRGVIGRANVLTLDKACRLLGVRGPMPGTISGADVAMAYSEGRIAAIVAHCVDDVERERELYLACCRAGVAGWTVPRWARDRWELPR